MVKQQTNTHVRLDKWLWAARFYKTRAIARQAIEGGKVEINGTRAKHGKPVQLHMQIKFRSGFDVREVEVITLTD